MYLSLDLQEKVLLWLTYRGLKPVSEITAEKRNKAILRKKLLGKTFRDTFVDTYDFNSPKSQRIKRWIHEAGLVFVPEPGGELSWHVGKKADQVNLSVEIIRKFDYDNELQSGLLFGFPEESAKAYAHNREVKQDQAIPMVGTGSLRFENPYLKDKYYTPYVLYNMPISRVEEDIQTAKLWADTIRKDVPKLAKWFENSEVRRLKKSRSIIKQ